MRDHQAIVIREFKGEFDRGSDDVCPPGYLLKARNVIFTNFGVRTRVGFDLSVTLPNIARIQTYKRIGEADRLLILCTDGKLYDSVLSLVTPILYIPTMTDFSMVNMFNRAYISPHNGVKGLPGEFLYVYQGSGTARKAGGTPPTGFNLGANDSAVAGHVDKGHHFIAMAFESDTGFITKLGPLTGTGATNFTDWNAPGNKKLNVFNIALGPTGTVARRIVSTKTIPDWTATIDQKLNEFFFIPNGRIADNTSTGPFDYDFYDDELVDSADYLLDSLDNPPAFVHVNDYNGSLVGVGEDLKESVCRVSKSGEPESFNGVEGFVVVNPSENQGLKYSVPLRGDLHLFKSQRHYMTRNNGNAPVFWPVIPIDSAIGTEPYGIAQVLDSKGQTMDQLIIITRQGLETFDGSYKPFPLSFVIKNIWDRINVSALNKAQICLNPINRAVYILIPVDGSSVVNMMLMMDYQNGLTWDNVRWSIWSFTSLAPRSCIVDTKFTDQSPILKLGCSSNIYLLNSASLNDNGVIIPDPEVETPLINSSYNSNPMAIIRDEGVINHFTGAKLRAVGEGFLQPIFSSLDRAFTLGTKNIPLSVAPGRELSVLTNFKSEKASISFKTQLINEWFHINKIAVFVSDLWSSRAM